MKNSESIILPKNIKLEIKNNVAELKELLKDDNEFLINLINLIVNVSQKVFPWTITGKVIEYYSDIIEQCKKEYKAWPVKISQVRNIVDLLTHLGAGDDKSIFDAFKDCDVKDLTNEYDLLGELCRKEIAHQFNPEVNYYLEIDRDLQHEWEMSLTGEDYRQDEDLI